MSRPRVQVPSPAPMAHDPGSENPSWLFDDPLTQSNTAVRPRRSRIHDIASRRSRKHGQRSSSSRRQLHIHWSCRTRSSSSNPRVRASASTATSSSIGRGYDPPSGSVAQRVAGSPRLGEVEIETCPHGFQRSVNVVAPRPGQGIDDVEPVSAFLAGQRCSPNGPEAGSAVKDRDAQLLAVERQREFDGRYRCCTALVTSSVATISTIGMEVRRPQENSVDTTNARAVAGASNEAARRTVGMSIALPPNRSVHPSSLSPTRSL